MIPTGVIEYVCVVNNYSSEIPLAQSLAAVKFQFDNNVEEYACPREGEGQWWIVFEYDRESDHLQVVNQIVNSTPPEIARQAHRTSRSPTEGE